MRDLFSVPLQAYVDKKQVESAAFLKKLFKKSSFHNEAVVLLLKAFILSVVGIGLSTLDKVSILLIGQLNP